MNKFLLNPKSLTPKRKPAPKEKENSIIAEPSNKNSDNSSKSTTEILHEAIQLEDAPLAFNILSKNRPFDLSMNKTMTKLEFSSNFSSPNHQFMILAVDESVINALENGENLTLRGEEHDDAVLCTENETYPIKVIESATTCLFMKEVLSPPDNSIISNPVFETKNIDGKCFATAEICPPLETLNISKLKDLLHEDELMWNWIDNFEIEKNKGKKLGDLLMCVQMSLKEIEQAISVLPVVKMSNGKFRYLSHQYRSEFYNILIDALDDDSKTEISMENICQKSLRDNLPENVNDEIIEWYISNRCLPIKESPENFKIDDFKLIQDLIIITLYSTHKMPLKQFYEIISKILPFGLRINQSHFSGICDIQENVAGNLMCYLAPEDLPDNIQDRMVYLFNHRRLWSMEQLRPFFTDLFKTKVSFDKYLVQKCDYTLSSTNEVLYCGVRS